MSTTFTSSSSTGSTSTTGPVVVSVSINHGIAEDEEPYSVSGKILEMVTTTIEEPRPSSTSNSSTIKEKSEPNQQRKMMFLDDFGIKEILVVPSMASGSLSIKNSNMMVSRGNIGKRGRRKLQQVQGWIKQKRKQRLEKLMFLDEDIWVYNIMAYVGPGQYIFVAGVSKAFQKLYRLYSRTTQDMISGQEDGSDDEGTIEAHQDSTFYKVAVSSVSLAKYCAKFFKNDNNNWTAKLCAASSKYGNLEVLEWAHQRGYSWDESTTLWAARGGHIDILQYAHSNGCPWDAGTCAEAAEAGHFHCLRYAYTNGCRWGPDTCAGAAKAGRLDMLQYARRNGCPWDERTCDEATENGHLIILQYAISCGCAHVSSRDLCLIAAQHGHMNILRYAHTMGWEWDEWTCSGAVANGKLEVLQFLHENGCPWDEQTCTDAASFGSLQVLKYAHENGCPWDESTPSQAARFGFLELVKYAHANGCPWNSYTVSEAIECGHHDIAQWALENGCPQPTSSTSSILSCWNLILCPLLKTKYTVQFSSTDPVTNQTVIVKKPRLIIKSFEAGPLTPKQQDERGSQLNSMQWEWEKALCNEFNDAATKRCLRRLNLLDTFTYDDIECPKGLSSKETLDCCAAIVQKIKNNGYDNTKPIEFYEFIKTYCNFHNHYHDGFIGSDRDALNNIITAYKHYDPNHESNYWSADKCYKLDMNIVLDN